MKTWKLSILAILTLVFATVAFAENKASITVRDAVNVNGKQLASGNYKLTWEGTGSAVELSILRGKEVVAKVPAKVVELPQPSAYDSVVYRDSASGRELGRINLGGKKFSLEVGDAAIQPATAAMK